MAHFGLFGFDDHLTGAGEVLFKLLELAVLADDFFELGVLLGELLEARGVADDLGRGELAGHFLITSVELIEFSESVRTAISNTSLDAKFGVTRRSDG